MIKIDNKVIKTQHNFWNHCIFHPTDAVEDPWGRRILDKIAEDKSIKMVRIYSMFEDVVCTDENGNLTFDFRLNDLRLDYLTKKGFDILIAYAGIPDCLSGDSVVKSSASKNKTRYKGKMWNTAITKDYSLWEEICYEYTKHIVERYGIDTVSKWRIHCFNEPDAQLYFLGDLPRDATAERLNEYCKLYSSFEKGVRRVSDDIQIGGPALARNEMFLDGFLKFVRKNSLKLDYISLHNYGTTSKMLNEGDRISVGSIITRHKGYLDIIKANGFDGTEIIVDEWGASTGGYRNREDCPALMFREHEVFSAYYVKLIRNMIDFDPNLSKLMICLSGQHEMMEDFSGFRNFFTLHFIKKPIYNAYILASKLGENLLSAKTEDENISVIPTKDKNGNYAILLSYASDFCEDTLPEREDEIIFSEDISDKTVTVFCIDKNTTNPYRMWERKGFPEMTEDMLNALREEGNLNPISIQSGKSLLKLKLTANCIYLITVS